jgi:hypothetical protein
MKASPSLYRTSGRAFSYVTQENLAGTTRLELATSAVTVLHGTMEAMGRNEHKLYAANGLSRIERHPYLVRVVRFSNHLDGLARQGYVTKHGTKFLTCPG